ncbi:MAG: hypothetical protein JNK45_23455, partial [Myxococcales bacterium]|nr:hypothetical protein [Myxococcales bacterium]
VTLGSTGVTLGSTVTLGSAGLTTLGLSLMLVACPAEVAPTPAVPAKPVVDETDPRVARVGEDLYPVAAIERTEKLERTPEPSGLGTGKPDESNGVCRLYAPRLPDPECCKGEYGVDADAVAKTCGLELYLGESFQGTCGYYFHRTGDEPRWLRASFVDGATPEDAAKVHDTKMKRVSKNDAFASEPVPGVEGALWSRNERLRWAFLPGWDKVRMVSWSSETCTDEAAAKVLGQIATAKQPAPGTPREGLVPRART